MWYSDLPYGKNKICSNVKTICEIVKIEGKFTNHSLRATSASRMFDQCIPEQVIINPIVIGCKKESVTKFWRKPVCQLLKKDDNSNKSDVKNKQKMKTESPSKVEYEPKVQS